MFLNIRIPVNLGLLVERVATSAPPFRKLMWVQLKANRSVEFGSMSVSPGQVMPAFLA